MHAAAGRARAGPAISAATRPGTILDALADTDYQFPASGLDAGRYVTVLQAELRAIASRLVMPEFMLTSDASNANYTSTMVAEGPAMKMFDRMQQDMIEDDLEVMAHVVHAAVAAGPAAGRRAGGGGHPGRGADAGGPRPAARRPGRSDPGAERGHVAGDHGHAARPRPEQERQLTARSEEYASGLSNPEVTSDV